MNSGLLSLADYHVHPDFSFDAKGSLDEFCEVAVERGLTEICFTTHYDTDPRLPEHHRRMNIGGASVPTTFENIGKYVDAVAETAEKYIGRELVVQCGIEVGYFSGCENEIKELFNNYNFHYKLGSIHQVGQIDICNEKSMQDAITRFDINQFGDAVFEDLCKSAECRLFDALGHVDMYKKYGIKTYGEGILKIHQGRIEKLFEIMSETGVGYELNTSGLRRGHSDYYPSIAIINMARAAGVRVVAVGSDAHRPEEVAFDFENAASIAYELTSPYCGE